MDEASLGHEESSQIQARQANACSPVYQIRRRGYEERGGGETGGKTGGRGPVVATISSDLMPVRAEKSFGYDSRLQKGMRKGYGCAFLECLMFPATVKRSWFRPINTKVPRTSTWEPTSCLLHQTLTPIDTLTRHIATGLQQTSCPQAMFAEAQACPKLIVKFLFFCVLC